MPQVGCNPDARRDTGKGKKESNLEAPKKVIVIQWAKKKYAGGKQDPKATSGVLPATAPCHLPDIEKADQGEEPTHKQLSPDVPMRQAPKSEKNQSWKKNSMFIVLREKVSKPQSAGRHFLKKRGGPIPFIPKWGVDAIPAYEKTD
jgi:hypothetical protein